MSTNDKKQKKKDGVQAAIRALEFSRNDLKHLERIAEHMIDPGLGPVVMPQRAPNRLGSATFPLVREFSFPSSSNSNFTVIAQPSLETPLRISRLASVPLSPADIRGTASFAVTDTFMEGTAPCAVLGRPTSDMSALSLVACPLSSNGVGTANFRVNSVGPKIRAQLWWLGDPASTTWTLLDDLPCGGSHGANSATVTIPVTVTAYAVVAIPQSQIAGTLQYSLTPGGGGGQLSCGLSYDERVMDTYFPNWDVLMGASKFAKVVCADMLITYEGSTLDNAGSIAIANVDDDLGVATGGTMYDTVASLPFDKYRGRLASEGQTEGGAHWHFIPNHEEQLEASAPPLDDQPMGIAGINGLLPDQVVRIECHFTVNFYSQDPSYKMVIPPPSAGLSVLLWQLRHDVPLVSSNDSHILKKLGMLGRKGARTASKLASTATSPETIKVLTTLAALL